MTNERFELLDLLSRSRPLSYLEVATATQRTPAAASMLLSRARRDGLVGSRDRYFFLTQRGVERLNWLRQYVLGVTPQV